ncbi:MAG: hypothetical protein NTU91_06645 [Chloroflexi bacterium]|nr:hypothetical protein [Chloroflexota bacterium]
MRTNRDHPESAENGLRADLPTALLAELNAVTRRLATKKRLAVGAAILHFLRLQEEDQSTLVKEYSVAEDTPALAQLLRKKLGRPPQ